MKKRGRDLDDVLGLGDFGKLKDSGTVGKEKE